MTFTYNGDPSNSDLDLIRFLLSDTDSTDVLLSDEEYGYMLTTWGNVYEAGRASAERIAGIFTRQADSISRTVGDLSISKSFSAKATQYYKLAEELAVQRARLFPATPVVNANSLLATANRTSQTPQSDFYSGMNDNRSF